ncbi:hypothetical protein [Xanthomonas phage DES1]|nr:hypothetical protein [Xanthomonas phage DES1]
MKARVEEIRAGEFVGKVSDHSGNCWSVVTKACDTAQEAQKLLGIQIIKLKATMDFNNRKVQGKHIIKEWEV